MLQKLLLNTTLKSICNIKCIRKFSDHSVNSLPKRIFSGIQPTGTIHLGNYLGAIRQWVRLQEEDNGIILSIVDLHSMTLRHDPKVLSENILKMTATLLAVGLDPKKVIIFQQSSVPQHTELFWYLSCISTMARLAHLPQYKEKSAQLKDIPLGLFVYPVLQAADILAYRATHVPVGEDQLQHLQLSQELTKMFNNRFKTKFPIPHAVITENAKIKSLRNPEKKMSKSDPDTKGCIYITDSEEEITKKIKKAITDFISEVEYKPETRPGVSNLVLMHSAVTGKPIETIINDAKGLSTAEYKHIVASEVNDHLSPIREKYYEYLDNPQHLLDVLESGRSIVTPIAEETLRDVRKALGVGFNVNNKQMLSVNI
nr:tryptophan--tRNA ligase, mitochondrial [Onthophagus taurus]